MKPIDPTQTLISREIVARMCDLSTRQLDRIRKTGKFGPRPISGAFRLRFLKVEVETWLATFDQNGRTYTAETWPPVWEQIQRKTVARH